MAKHSMIVWQAAAVAGLMLGVPAMAQDGMMLALEQAGRLVEEGKPLAAIRAFESQATDAPQGSQYLATLYSFVGELERVSELRADDQRQNTLDVPPSATFAAALDAIAEAARDRRVVIINESHDAPHHRDFILQLARKLRAVGFDHFAMETLSEDPQLLRARGYPVRSTGYYSKEPVFGDLIRQVLKLGYVPVAYEAVSEEPLSDPVSSINRRDQVQCDNLVSRVIKARPDARLLVHVGYSHVKERPEQWGDGEVVWLAGRLKQSAGIDPLTIDQITRLREVSAIRIAPRETVVLVDADGRSIVSGQFEGAVDLQVFHPPAELRAGRPDWLYRGQERMAVPIPVEIDERSATMLVQAFHAEEPDTAVPADQVLLHRNEPPPVLMLRPGDYRIMVQDDAGNLTAGGPLSVPESVGDRAGGEH